MSTLQSRRGTDAQRLTITPLDGEFIWTTDTKKLYIGDGSTVGGIEVTDAENLPELPASGLYKLRSDGSSGTWETDLLPDPSTGLGSQVVAVNASSTAYTLVNQSGGGGGGVTIATTTAELATAEAIGSIAFINATGVTGKQLSATLGFVPGSSTFGFFRINSISGNNVTFSTTRGNSSIIIDTDTDLYLSVSTVNSTGNGVVTIPINKDFVFRLSSAVNTGGNVTSFILPILTTGPFGVTVNSTNFPNSKTLFRQTTRGLDNREWYGFDGHEWFEFNTVVSATDI